MKKTIIATFLITAVICMPYLIMAGEPMRGDIKYQFDISQPFKRSEYSDDLKAWRDSLVSNLKHHGTAMVFLPTDIKLLKNELEYVGLVYQCYAKPNLFYIINSNVMINFENKYVWYPGYGGFSAHAPRSKRLIVCLNYEYGGLPYAQYTFNDKLVEWMGTDKYPLIKVQ